MTTSGPSPSPSPFPSSAVPFPAVRAPGCPFDPPPLYARLRQEAPVRVRIWDGSTPWLVTRHDDMRAVLGDPRFSADPSRPGFPSPSAGFKALGAAEVQAFVTRDDPEHARQRRMLTGHFTVRRTAALAPRIQEIIDGLLDRMAAVGPPADLVEDFALPMPSLVIGELLGVPPEDQPLFQRAARAMIARDSGVDEFTAARTELADYLTELIAHKDRSRATTCSAPWSWSGSAAAPSTPPSSWRSPSPCWSPGTRRPPT